MVNPHSSLKGDVKYSKEDAHTTSQQAKEMIIPQPAAHHTSLQSAPINNKCNNNFRRSGHQTYASMCLL